MLETRAYSISGFKCRLYEQIFFLIFVFFQICIALYLSIGRRVYTLHCNEVYTVYYTQCVQNSYDCTICTFTSFEYVIHFQYFSTRCFLEQMMCSIVFCIYTACKTHTHNRKRSSVTHITLLNTHTACITQLEIVRRN